MENALKKSLEARYLFILAPFFLILITSLFLFTINFSWFLLSACSAFAFLLAATGYRTLLAAAFFLQIATALLDPQQLIFTSFWYVLLHIFLSITLLLTALGAAEVAAEGGAVEVRESDASETELITLQKALLEEENDSLEGQFLELLDENAHLEADNRELLHLLNKQLGIGRPVRRSILKKKKKS